MNSIILAASGEGLVRQLWVLAIIVICAGILWAFGKWAIKALKVPPHALTVWDGIFLLVGVLVVINFLLSLIGYPVLRL